MARTSREIAGQVLRKQIASKAEAIDEARRTVRFVISTSTPDRDNDTIAASGWKLDNYKANPTVLFAHDSRSLPVAKAIEVYVQRDSLIAVAQFATRDEYDFADTVFRLIVGGYLRATSVGFLPIKWRENTDRAGPNDWWLPVDFLEQELLEFSIVPVPANPEALIDAKSKGIDTASVDRWAEGWLANSKAVPKVDDDDLIDISPEELRSLVKAAVKAAMDQHAGRLPD